MCRAVFPDKPYVSLKSPDLQEFARRDPRGFLERHRDGAVLDEVHRVPDLLSHVQTMVDERLIAGRFILTGSANFALLQSLGQSLAGRTALLDLLPLGLEEVRRFADPPDDLFDLLWRGSYPAVYDRGLNPGDWYPRVELRSGRHLAENGLRCGCEEVRNGRGIPSALHQRILISVPFPSPVGRNEADRGPAPWGGACR